MADCWTTLIYRNTDECVTDEFKAEKGEVFGGDRLKVTVFIVHMGFRCPST